MKILKTSAFALAIILTSAFSVSSQSTRQEKKAAKEEAMKKVLESKDFTFNVQTANPMRGGTVNVALNYYDLKIVPDSVFSFLPYYGVAYMVPMAPRDGGIKFTSTDFSYVATPKKNSYQIVIKPKDNKEVQLITLDVSTSGYGTLHVTNTMRDPITFYGYVEANKTDKKQL